MKHLFVYCSGLFYLVIFTLLLGSETLLAQVTVAPVMLFIDSKSGIGNLYITNNSATPQELNINFVYGYPDADSAGNPKMNYSDTLSAGMYSLNPMIRAYPRSFILNGKQAQTIRLQVRTKGSVKDASYFSRVKVTSSQKAPEIEKKPAATVATQINFKFDQVFPVFYRKGNVTTGLVVHDVTTNTQENKLIVIADVERTGNTPYIGSMRAELISASNEKVALSEATASIYFRLKEKIELDVSKITKGKYRLLLTYETKRSDIAVEDLLQAPTVTKEVAVNLQ
jgi:P pilus assembly chaperone PapD